MGGDPEPGLRAEPGPRGGAGLRGPGLQGKLSARDARDRAFISYTSHTRFQFWKHER